MIMKNIDIRIKKIDSLVTPQSLIEKYPVSEELSTFLFGYRKQVNDIIQGKDSRKLAIVGPCSIHNEEQAIDYAQKLAVLSEKVKDTMLVVMRTYFEKPRTVLGWKGLIMDPNLDGTCDIELGLNKARKLLIEIVKLGIGVGCEVLDPIIPQYIDDVICWSSIGARTSQSQVHRSLASGLSTAVGFKNGTDGDLKVAINSIKASSFPASFIGIDRQGNDCVFRTIGNDCGHLILRGGNNAPNYYEDDIQIARRMMVKSGLNPSIIIDCSHGNSRKVAERQKRVLRSVMDQIVWSDDDCIKGFMLESFLKTGSQKLTKDLNKLEYGVSVTDECLGWKETEEALLFCDRELRKKRG